MQARPMGAPDGTGMRPTHLLACPDAFPLLSFHLRALSRANTSSAGRRFYATKSLSGQLKPGKDGTYPATVAAITSTRPLSRHHWLRRIVANRFATPSTRRHRLYLESLSQLGGSSAGTEAAARRLQLIADIYPNFIHHVLDVENAHSSISRLAVYNRLSAIATAPDAEPCDADALLYFLMYYGIPGASIVQSGINFLVSFQTDALDQGDGMANFFFNITYTPVLAAFIAAYELPLHHPPLPLATLVHDDTTLVLPLSLNLGSHHPPPLFPAFFAALTAHLLLILRLRIAAPKTLHFQMPLRLDHPCSIAHLRPHLASDAEYSSSVYRLAGGPVGTSAGRRAWLVALEATYAAALHKFTSIPGIKRHASLTILALCLRPSTRFNHHLRIAPPSLTTTADDPFSTALADRSRTSFIRALATVFAVDPSAFTANPTTFDQLFSPASRGGLGIPDPTILAETAYLASVADSLPALASDPLLAHVLADTASWHSHPCVDLADAAASFTRLTSLPEAAVSAVDADDFDHPTALSRLFDPALDSFSLPLLTSAAHLHLQRSLSNLKYRARRRALLETDLPPLDRARLLAATVPGATSILLVRTLPADIAVSDAAITFYVFHLLGIPVLTNLGCSRAQLMCRGSSCSKIPPHRPITSATHPLLNPDTIPQDAYHHVGCGGDSSRTTRHDAIAAAMATRLQPGGARAGRCRRSRWSFWDGDDAWFDLRDLCRHHLR